MTSSAPVHSALGGIDYSPRTRLIFGEGCVARVGELVRELQGSRVLLVTDPGIAKAGHTEGVIRAIESVGVEVFLYDQVRENPTTRDVQSCVHAARSCQADFFVGLGGGSSMDTAKGCNFILTNGGEMKDYWGVGKAKRPMLPLIAIPTTAGTGSECQSAALIADEVTHQKMACLDPKAAAAVALLDPVLTLSMPTRVTACTGLDAMAHALETGVTVKRNSISALFSREAFRLCAAAFPTVMQDSKNLAARGRMLLGAAYAGTAIENSMLGAVHAAANPLTAHHSMVHGHAVGLLLPAVVRWNARSEEARAEYLHLATAVGLDSVEELVELLRSALTLSGLPSTLSQCGVTEASLDVLATEAATQWTARFNPRPVVADDFLELYRGVL